MSSSNEFHSKLENNYIVLARRTRPQSFAELIGQEVVANSMTSMLESKKLPHAFLFTGTRGTGKTSSARILAKSLCCEKGPTPYPCQVCIHCKQITACAHDDVLEIDGASNTGVDNVRELNEAARFYPHSAKYKVFIIDEVHMLSSGAFNALLKTLEEPPSQVIFILATTELHKVPITVRSRCMIFSFKKIDTQVISNHLAQILQKENITFEEDALQIIAREAKGSLRDSLSLLEQAIAICGGSHLSAEKTKNGLCVQGEEIAERLFSAICQKNSTLAFEALQDANQSNLDGATLIEGTAGLFRSAMLVKNLQNKEKTLRLVQLLSKEYDFLSHECQNLTNAALSEIFKALSQSVREIARSTAPYAWAEIVVIDCILRADWLSATELFESLKQGGLPPHQGASQPPLQKHIISSKEIEKKNTIIATEVFTVKEAANEVKPISIVDNQKVDLNLFKKFVQIARGKSELLATKLQFVKINTFQVKQIEFANSPENETYLSLSSQDAEYFWESILEMGFQTDQVQGKYLPPRPMNKQKSTNEILENQLKEHKKIVSEIHAHKESTKTIFKNFQKFSGQSTVKQDLSQSKTVSLNEIYNEEKSKARSEKAQKILGMESVQQLNKLATEIKIFDL